MTPVNAMVRKQELFVHRIFGDSELADLLQLISISILAALLATTLMAGSTADRFPQMTFSRRFANLFFRLALPTCIVAAAIYWLLWGG
jgi:hypothetical protein